MLRLSTLDLLILVNILAWCLLSHFCLKSLNFRNSHFIFIGADGIFQIASFKTVFGFASLIYRRWVVFPFDDSLCTVQTYDQSFHIHRGSWYVSSFLLFLCFIIEIQWRWGTWHGIKRICRFYWKVSVYLLFIFSNLGSIILCL